MRDVPRGLREHPDRLRWNARYAEGASFAAPALAVRALSQAPAGPVLDLACGTSGSGLLVAAAGRRVTAVDISEAALELLEQEARRRGLQELITVVQADLPLWRPPEGAFALVLCTGYWDRDVFARAIGAVVAGGLLGWEAFTDDARRARPGFPAEWCLGPGEPSCLLPADFVVVDQDELPDARHGARRRMLARRISPADG